jgi:hypothetical protein
LRSAVIEPVTEVTTPKNPGPIADAALIYEVELTAGFTLRFIPNAAGSNIHSDLLLDDHLVSANVGS